MNRKLEQTVRIAPATWAGPELEVEPGDLSQFVPSGLGLGAPMVMMPWDTLEDAVRRSNYYGFSNPSAHPFHNGPLNEAAGGVAYFDGEPEREKLDALFSLLDVRGWLNEYAVFWSRSENPLADRYVEQLRIVSQFGIFSEQKSLLRPSR